MAALLGVLVPLLSSCGLRGGDQDGSGQIQSMSPAGQALTKADLTYASVRKKVLEPRCLRCHDSKAPESFETYASTSQWIDDIRRKALVERTMPPNGPLPDDEARLLQAWIDAGAPESADPGPGPSVPHSPVPAPSSNPGDVGVPASTGSSNPPAETPSAPTPAPSDSTQTVTPATPTPEPTPSSNDGDPGVTITPTPEPTPAPTLQPLPVVHWDQVRTQVFERRCTECHSGSRPAGRLDLTKSHEVRVHGNEIWDRVIRKRTMPPSDRQPLTDSEYDLLKNWMISGMSD